MIVADFTFQFACHRQNIRWHPGIYCASLVSACINGNLYFHGGASKMI